MGTKALEYEQALPPVDSSKREVRILQIHPGEGSSAIRCSFCVSNVHNLQISYTAISYAWGDTTVMAGHEIELNDIEVSVTETIADVLRRLRQKESMKNVWLDALCINQTNKQEKSEQVSMMYEIYTRCENCAIWLGSLAGTSLTDAMAASELLTWIAGETKRPTWLEDEAKRRSAAKAFKKVLNLPWWSRIWTVQEAILPERSVVYWGECAISWDTFKAAADSFFNGSAPGIPGEFWNNGSVGNLQHAMKGLEISRGETLFRLLWRWRYRNATDPRDKVYGLLGFRKDTLLPSVKTCDYSLDVKSLYEKVTVDLIRQSGDLLPLIGRGGEGSDIPGLASWAMDWHGVKDELGRSKTSFWDHHRQWKELGYTADRGLRGVGDGLDMEGESILVLKGLQVDRILVVEDMKESDLRDGKLTPSNISSTIIRWENLISKACGLTPDILPENWMMHCLGLLRGNLSRKYPNHGDDTENWVRQIIRAQVFFITEMGKFGLGPPCTQPGDEVWLVGGSRLPLILRRQNHNFDSNLDFRFVAECFVHGIMKGEAAEGREHDHVDIKLH